MYFILKLIIRAFIYIIHTKTRQFTPLNCRKSGPFLVPLHMAHPVQLAQVFSKIAATLIYVLYATEEQKQQTDTITTKVASKIVTLSHFTLIYT